MILESARIENFKCIEDSTEFTIRQLTCLVGKNESGKTALLRALYRLNPVIASEGDFDELEYPRRKWTAYRQRKPVTPARVVSTTWRLDAEDQGAVADAFGPGVLNRDTVTIAKGYDNRLSWDVQVNERAVVSNMARAAHLEAEELRPLWPVTTLQELITVLQAVEAPSVQQAALLREAQRASGETPVWQTVVDILYSRLPRLVYFAEYHHLPAAVSIDELVRRKAANRFSIGDEIFLALLDLANTSLEEIQKTTHFEYLIAELEAVSERVTRDVLESWSQDRDLEVEFRCDAAKPNDPPPFNTGYVLRTRIRNRRHSVTLGFDERSAGFTWFFSFLVWLSAVRKRHDSGYILLLDEPGLSLHARGQMDLLRFIKERLRPHYQLLYSTHSPFMIDVDDLLSVRTVEDVTENGVVRGTKVGDRTFSTDPDTLFALQAALAYDVARGSFVGDQTLLVDRPGDVLLLTWFSRELQLQGRECLDAGWVIVPVGGIDKLGSFSSAFAGQNMKVAVVTSGVVSDRERLLGLRDRGLLSTGRVLKASIYVDQDEADIEDLLGRQLYVALVHACYGLNGANGLPAERPADAPDCVLEEVSHHFAALPPWTPPFDPYGPAAFLVENAATLRGVLPGMAEALDRFENLFRDLNRVLGE